MRALALFLALVVVAPIARAEPAAMKADARAHYDRGLKLYERHQYDDAIGELRAALAIDPQPDILYALGQAERRRGHCERAIDYYQSALALVKQPAAAAALRVQIERCKVETGEPKDEPAQLPEGWKAPDESPAAAPTPAPVTAPPPTTAPAATRAPSPAPRAPSPSSSPHAVAPVAAPAVARPAPARWSHDALGWSLVGGGVAVGAVGGALMGVAHARLDAAGDSYQGYADAQSAPSLWTGGVVVVAVGGALVLGGVVRLAVIAAREHR